MSESKLQSEMVIEFSQEMPQERGKLWATLNRTLSIKDGMKQKGMGLIEGVSDLIYYDTILVGIEVKSPGTIHKKTHIEKQLKWGLKIEASGGMYFIVTNLKGFWDAINKKDTENNLNTRQIKELINKSKSTVKF